MEIPQHESPRIARLPPGYRGARGQVLLELKRSGRLTVKELGIQIGLSLNAVRHHLKELEAAGLVVYERVQSGAVGAPRFAYRLSAAGESLFPQGYKETLRQLPEHLVARAGRAAAPPAAATSARIRAATGARDDEGCLADAHATFCCAALTDHHRAIREAAERFPEFCAAEGRFLERALGGQVERRLHLLGGDGACEYKVRFGPESRADSTETA